MRMSIPAAAIATALVFSGAAMAMEAPSLQRTQADCQSAPEGAPEQAANPQQSNPPAATDASVLEKSVEVDGVRRIVVTNGPVPDTPENRERFPPLSALGRSTTPQGR